MCCPSLQIIPPSLVSYLQSAARSFSSPISPSSNLITLIMSTNNNTPSTHSSYNPSTTSRFLAFGKSNPKYPASLGKSLPSTLSKDVSILPKSSRSTLSALAPEFVPRSASGSTTSASLPGSLQSSPLRSKSHPPLRPTKLDLKDQATPSKAVARPLQHSSVPALYSPQFSVIYSLSFPSLSISLII